MPESTEAVIRELEASSASFRSLKSLLDSDVRPQAPSRPRTRLPESYLDQSAASCVAGLQTNQHTYFKAAKLELLHARGSGNNKSINSIKLGSRESGDEFRFSDGLKFSCAPSATESVYEFSRFLLEETAVCGAGDSLRSIENNFVRCRLPLRALNDSLLWR
jgi:hypothetical protein